MRSLVFRNEKTDKEIRDEKKRDKRLLLKDEVDDSLSMFSKSN